MEAIISTPIPNEMGAEMNVHLNLIFFMFFRLCLQFFDTSIFNTENPIFSTFISRKPSSRRNS